MQQLFMAHPPPSKAGICSGAATRKQFARTIWEIEANLCAMVDAIPVPLVVSDGRGRTLHLNRAFLESTGYTLDDIPTMAGWLSRACPDPHYRQRVAQSWQDNLEKARLTGGTFAPMELDVRCKDGQVRTFMGCAAILEKSYAEICLTLLHDITGRKLNERNIQFATTAFASQDGMLITDAHSVILMVNNGFTQITGYSADEAIGRHPNMLNSARHDAGFYADMWKSIRDAGGWAGEIWNRRKNGEIYPGHLAITAVKDRNGAVTNYVATFSDTTLNKVAVDEFDNLAFYDPLTYLPNRRFLLDRLHQALAQSIRTGWHGALLPVDLDNFKDINDTLGHSVGDLMLVEIANRLQSCVQRGDTIARLGADEFIVLIENMGEGEHAAAAHAEAVGEKIHEAIRRPYLFDGHEHYCTASIGVTLFHGSEKTLEEMLKRADVALFQAKKAGGNTLRFFDPAIQAAIAARAALETDLRRAVSDQRQFQLYYQAQVDSSGRLTGAESLVRWLHPVRGRVSPAEFIPLAEESGLILPLGHWVLTAACRQLAAWAAQAETAHLTLSVNVSAKQFHLPTFVDEVLTLVGYFRINPAKLKLEITESMLLGNVDDIIAKMTELKARGITFSMDDFGTGYSSLQYLKRLPLDQLKIDQSFVRDILDDDGDKAIVRTIIAMAQGMNLNVIAEGVETEAQRQFLLDKGCTHYQGFLFGEPVPVEQFEKLLIPEKTRHHEEACSLIGNL